MKNSIISCFLSYNLIVDALYYDHQEDRPLPYLGLPLYDSMNENLVFFTFPYYIYWLFCNLVSSPKSIIAI